MKPDMRLRLPHLHKEITRHGKTAWYVRLRGGPRFHILGTYGSPEFLAAYQEAIVQNGTPNRQGGFKDGVGSLAWLIARYRDSLAWEQLAVATRRQRENIFLQVIKTAGNEPFTAITRKTIIEGIDRRKASPFAAKDFLKAMRGLFSWALDAEHVKTNPTIDIVAPVPRTEGFHVWTEDEIDRFEARWPIGTRERLAIAILLYTGLRRGDAARLGPQHVKDRVITIRTEKTNTLVVIPVLPILADIIAATPTGDLAFITTKGKDSFGQWFIRACRAAEVPGTAHGLRKAGAT